MHEKHHHPDHVSHRRGRKDDMAHDTHHAHNKEHGMEHGFCPPDDDEHMAPKSGGEGMASNEKHVKGY